MISWQQNKQKDRHECLRIFINWLHWLNRIYMFYTQKLHPHIHGMWYQSTFEYSWTCRSWRLLYVLQYQISSSWNILITHEKKWFSLRNEEKINNFIFILTHKDDPCKSKQGEDLYEPETQEVLSFPQAS